MSKNVAGKSARIYFAIHFLLEVVCFYMMTGLKGDAVFIGTAAVIYNLLAFVPQLMIGTFLDLFPKIRCGIPGAVLLLAGFSLYHLTEAKGPLFWICLVILCTGNSFLHISGAELTLRASDGKLSPVAVFVSGGSFGVVTGQMLALFEVPVFIPLVLGILILPLVIYADTLYRDIPKDCFECANYSLTSPGRAVAAVVAAAFLIVTVRAFLGYGIPTSWNKTYVQTILLYAFLGIGKALGGILSDSIGAKKTAAISILGAVPFLVFGDRIMIISLIGLMFFSMTMSITVGMLVSVMKFAPGAAFGITTVGLFAGTTVSAVLKIESLRASIITIVISSAVCYLLASCILAKDKRKNDIINKNKEGN